MKKILILTVLIIMLCGCTANYELEIIDDKISETIDLQMDSAEKENISNFYNIPVFIDAELTKSLSSEKENGIIYYDKKDNIYSHTFDYKDYYKSYFVNSAYGIFKVLYDQVTEESNDKTTIISTESTLKLFDDVNNFDTINVKITTNHKVKYHNADKTEGNTYFWKLNSDEDKNDVNFEYYQDKYILNYNNSLIKKIVIIIGVVILIGAILVLAIKNNKKRSN